MSKIKNIIFDLGGVLLDIDYNKTISAFKDLGIPNFDEMFTQFHADALFEDLETGKISEDDFYSAIKKAIPHPVSNNAIDTAWNAMILHFPPQKLEFLAMLSRQYNLFLLSNTNSIHLNFFRKVFTRDTGKPTIDSYFIKAWYSHLVGMRKPYREIYAFVLQDANLQAAETLFIDDTQINIESAAHCGLQTYWLMPGQKVEELGL